MRRLLFGRSIPRWQVGLALGTVAVVVILVVLLVLLNVPPKPQGSVTAAQVRITGQGSTTHGTSWFGPSVRNYSGEVDGYPFAYPTGSTFNFSFQMVNTDVHGHNVSQVTTSSPFHVASTNPILPYAVGAGDDFLLTIVLQTPSSAQTSSLNITITIFG